MEDEMKKYFKQALKHSATVTRIAATGGSGAGKTTSTLELIDRFASQFIYSNIGAIQSSKIRTVIIPVCLEENKKRNACFGIHFMKYSEIELVKNAFHNALSEKLMRAYRSYENDDAKDIVEKILAPENRMYDISAYCDENRRACLTEAVDKVCVSLIEGNEDFLPLNDVIKKKKAKVEQQGKKFDLKDAFEQELVLRLDSYLVDLDPVYNEIYGITDEMKRDIRNKVETFRDRGLEIESGESENEMFAYIDESENSCKLANELFSFMYKKDGKDLVVSHLTLIAEMSESVKTVFFDSGIFRKTNLPLFKIYDLKGLEAGKESIDETLIKLRESLPDAILAYHRANDIKDYFISYLNRIQQEFKNVPVTILLTHSDVAMKAYVRNVTNGYGAKKKGEAGYEEYYNEQVRVAYERLKEENQLFNEKTSKDVILCSMIDECGDIDKVFKEDNKELYQENRMAELIAGICKEQYAFYKKIPDDVPAEIVEQIGLSFNDEKLVNIVNKIVTGNKAHAAANYYNQKNLQPHWNTIYKWRGMHRGGSGWTSNAQVYDNISIYISNFVSGFINKAELGDAIEISVPENVSLEQSEYFKETMKKNIQKHLDTNYWGFFYKLKQEMTYKAFEEEFNKTYFVSALELINKKLSDFDYIKDTMNRVLEEYTDYFKALTFHRVQDKQENE